MRAVDELLFSGESEHKSLKTEQIDWNKTLEM